jgi:hypothetical protein
MIDDEEHEALERIRQAIDSCKRGIITRDELRRRLYDEAARQEQAQWRIVEDLRTKAPENERELGQLVADLLEEELRKGHGHA